MKLSQDDIQFIDTYLKNSDILYNDIRAEMVDHVASDIEQQIQMGDDRSFYYIFKDYMIEHKKALQHSNKAFIKQTDKKIGVELLKQLFSLKSIVVFSLIFLIFKILETYLNEASFLNFISYLPYCSMLLSLIFPVFTIKEVKNYSAIKRLSIIYYLLFYQIVYVFSNPFGGSILSEMVSKNGVVLITTFLMTTVIAMFMTSLKYKKEYQFRYKHIS